MRHWRCTLPGKTQACLDSLTDCVVRLGALGPLAVRVKVTGEVVSGVDPAAQGRRANRQPEALTWSLVRGIRQSLVFLVAMQGERY